MVMYSISSVCVCAIYITNFINMIHRQILFNGVQMSVFVHSSILDAETIVTGNIGHSLIVNQSN